MGQKVNPNVFRLGVNKTWKTEFFENKLKEFPLYTFKDLEIKNYIERFLEVQGIILHDYKQHYSDSVLNLYISYFVTPEFLSKNNDKLFITNKMGQKKVIKLRKKNLNEMFRVLNLFTSNKFNIIVNFCCINKNLNFLKSKQKKNFVLLRKFRNTPFLKYGVELLFYVVHTKNSANLLAKFIANNIQKIKRHNFFLSFLKRTLTVLLNSTFSKVKGIKILVKGRLNGVPRAKHKLVVIGDVPVQSIFEKVDYSQITGHNASGSYGIKVWVIENKT